MNPAPVGYQCPDCVTRARREFSRGPAARARRARQVGGASVTQILIIANIAMFAVEVIVGGAQMLGMNPSSEVLYKLGALYPPAVAHGEYWRLFSSMFLHAGILHIALNMYALYLFGPVVEDALGRAKFTLIYFVSGFVAAATSYAFGPTIELGVGASGAIVGVFGAFVAYNWRRRHSPLAQANLRLAATLILLNAILNVSMSSLDWHAHLGGLIAGFAAGWVAEGVGSRQVRSYAIVGGFIALALVGLALVVWRTGQLAPLVH
jgi:membrane associated rhomboid family serine protease